LNSKNSMFVTIAMVALVFFALAQNGIDTDSDKPLTYSEFSAPGQRPQFIKGEISKTNSKANIEAACGGSKRFICSRHSTRGKPRATS